MHIKKLCLLLLTTLSARFSMFSSRVCDICHLKMVTYEEVRYDSRVELVKLLLCIWFLLLYKD